MPLGKISSGGCCQLRAGPTDLAASRKLPRGTQQICRSSPEQGGAQVGSGRLEDSKPRQHSTLLPSLPTGGEHYWWTRTSLTSPSSTQRHWGTMPHGSGGSPLLAHQCEPPLENPPCARTTAPLQHRAQHPHAARGWHTQGPQQSLSPSQDQISAKGRQKHFQRAPLSRAGPAQRTPLSAPIGARRCSTQKAKGSPWAEPARLNICLW